MSASQASGGPGGGSASSAAVFQVGFNPVPMAHEVAMLGGRLRARLLWTLLGAVLWTLLWSSHRFAVGIGWLLAGYGLSLVVIAVMVLRLLRARRDLARIGSGPALEAGPQGLRLHPLDGEPFDLAWTRVEGVRASGPKVGAGPLLVVAAEGRAVWSVPLSFLDALPGTIDAGLRSCSRGRVALDLSGLDALL